MTLKNIVFVAKIANTHLKINLWPFLFAERLPTLATLADGVIFLLELFICDGSKISLNNDNKKITPCAKVANVSSLSANEKWPQIYLQVSICYFCDKYDVFLASLKICKSNAV